MTTPGQQQTNSAKAPERWQAAIVCLVLAALTFGVFGRTFHYGFLDFDDNAYVYENPHVKDGLTLHNLAWTFTHVDCTFYHPLTMLSLMVDEQFHGLHAGGFHFTNVLLHCASVILLFLILRQMTGAMWRSAFVAAVFAIHPLRVESVAWVAERKDVLSGLFFVLTLGAYARYALRPWSGSRYGMVLLLFAMGLLSKPTLVTLPAVLLMLDYWPLRRFELESINIFRIPKKLILEKLPFLLLSALAAALTVVGHHQETAAGSPLSLPAMICNSLVSYALYIRQMLWPENMAAYYPYPAHPAVMSAIFAALVLSLLTALAWLKRRSQPWLVVGWIWYLVMMLPVAGVIQFAMHAHADRNTYLPQIGLALSIIWLLAEWPLPRAVRAVLMGAITLALAFCSWHQEAYWQDDETLWNHAFAVTTDNEVAHYNLGAALFDKGRADEAIAQLQLSIKLNPHYSKPHAWLARALLQKGKTDEALGRFTDALQIDPADAQVHNSFGEALLQAGKPQEAAAHFQRAVQLKPDFAKAHYNLAKVLLDNGRYDPAAAEFAQAARLEPNLAEIRSGLGSALLHLGRLDEAAAQFRQALQLKPSVAQTHYNLGNILLQQGNLDEAVAQYQSAASLDPNYAPAHVNLGVALLQMGNADDALLQFQRGLQLDPSNAPAHVNLAGIYLRKGKLADAIAQFQFALQRTPNDPETQNSLAWLLATAPDASLRNGERAQQLAAQANQTTGGHIPGILRTLAAASAELGQYDNAIREAQSAIDLLQAAQRQDLATPIETDLKHYQARQPLHP